MVTFWKFLSKAEEWGLKMEKWRPWERKAKIGENVPSKSLVWIMGLVYLRCSSGEGRQEPVPDAALGQRDGRCCFCVSLWSRAGIKAG